MSGKAPIRFATLGPSGSNHEFVARRYIDFRRLQGSASIELHADFASAADSVLSGRADFLLQCAVHPATPSTVARYFSGLYVIDTFISASRDLAVVRRTDAVPCRTVAAMSATLGYADLERWGEVVAVDTVAAAADGLLDGRFDAALVFDTLVAQHPGRFTVEQKVESVDDAWLVYGCTRVAHGEVIACDGAPAADLYGRLLARANESV